MSRLRAPQREVYEGVNDSWGRGNRIVMGVLPTGGGKSVLAGAVAMAHDGAGCAIAHRGELIGQLSVAYAREGVTHDLVVSKPVRRQIVAQHMRLFSRNFVDTHARWKIASVDTLIRRDGTDRWFNDVTKFIGDEGHHFLKANKWGRAIGMFRNPNLKGLLLTAFAGRTDGAGLGSNTDGVVDDLVIGQGLRWHINNGYLTDYEIFCPKTSDLNLDGVEVGINGELNTQQLADAMRKSTCIVGDIVKTYIKHAYGKLGVTFAANIEEATKITAAFNAAGVPAALVTAETSVEDRARILQDFAARKLWQLVNVDLFGEGFDLPAIECVSFGRATASFQLYTQQWGRALRLMISDLLQAPWDSFTPAQRKAHIAASPKPVAYIFDHVGNLLRHKGPPDRPVPQGLDRRDRRPRGPNDDIAQRICTKCEKPFEAFLLICPYCKEPVPEPDPAARSSPDKVDGDLYQLLPDVVAMMRGEVVRIDGPAHPPKHLTPAIQQTIHIKHAARQQAQLKLRDTIALWAGHNALYDDRTNYRRFFHTFKIDVLSAMALNEEDATVLADRVANHLQRKWH